MNTLQFTIDEDLSYSPISPDVIDITSESGEEFIVELGDTTQLDERFRINPMGSNIKAAFVGSATAALFPSTYLADQQGVIDTACTRIERDIMELIGENPFSPSTSPLSFIDSEFEEVNMSPRDPLYEPETQVKSYWRPVAAILPTPRTPRRQSIEIVRPIPTYPPDFAQESSNFQQLHANDANNQRNADHPTHEQESTLQQTMFNPEELQYPVVSDIIPVVIHLPPRNMVDIPANFVEPPQQFTQFGLPSNTLHSANVPLITVNERQKFRLLPTVTPNVSGYCQWCGRTFDQVALETLGDYFGATAYDGETVSDRGVRSTAFIVGFEASLFIFKNARLSRSQRCDGSGVQQ